MENSLLTFTKNIILNVEKLDDVVDQYFEGIKDYTDTASDIFTPIKAIGSLYTFNKKRKYKNFLKGYAKSLETGEFNKLLQTERLQEYLKNERNYNFLHETIENAVNSKSVYGALLLGSYAGRTLAGENHINFKDVITIDVLKELNDYELSCFVRIYSTVNLADKEINVDNYKKLKPIRFFCDLTVTKMINLRALEKATITFDGGETLKFISTEVAEDIYFLIQNIGIQEDLLLYEF